MTAASDTLRSGLYHGRVVHSRTRPVRHRFAYRVFMLLLDLDELPALDRDLRLFSAGGPGLFSFRDRDHGPADRPVRAWIDDALAREGLAPERMRVAVLCFPRLFGHVFNPLSVYFCHDRASGAPRAIVYEVHNTFGGRHAYVLPVGQQKGAAVEQSCDKAFFVSPFIGAEGRYRFRVGVPGAGVALSIEERDGDGPFFQAGFSGARAALSDRTLLGALFRYPLMSYRIVAAIHWQAFLLWLKGAPFRGPRRSPRALVRGNLRDAG